MRLQTTTQNKALKINLAREFYGTVAEIGAGQEVAAHFFQAGGSSGTIAKTMSAYDMKFSDAIYGRCRRYVSEERLLSMLKREFVLLKNRLEERAANTLFFSFANTMEVLNFQKTNQGRGWLGIRFQLHPQDEENECVMHLKMYDTDAILQQKAAGIIGINLIYACFYHHSNPDLFLKSLMDNISFGSVEIDFVRIKGPDFEDVDNRLLSLKLVANEFSKATMFAPNGEVLMPSESLYKKNILVLRGRFRPVTHVNIDMLQSGMAEFFKEKEIHQESTLILTELTLTDLQNKDRQVNTREFLDTADLLCSLKFNVLISNYPEYYLLVDYLSSLNKNKKIGIILGIYNLQNIFKETYYKNLAGGILEAFGRLFGRNVKLYVYPSLNRKNQTELYTFDKFEVASSLQPLYDYLRINDRIEEIKVVDEQKLSIISDNVLKMIKQGKNGWEQYVPDEVATQIKQNYLFELPMEAKFSN